MSDTTEVPTELVERCVERMQWAADTLYRQAGGRGRNGERAARMREDIDALREYLSTEESEPKELPPGYTRTHTNGGYYEVRDADGEAVEGPSNGKFQGKDGAAEGAWADYQST